jgi:radical SAM superfamily enzyme YgiQ (UPF0313 family)
MQIALVFPPFFHPALYNLPPPGLLGLAATLRGTPHAVTVHDLVLALRDGSLEAGPHLYDDCARRIATGRPDLVAFSAQCTTYPPTVAIARRLRALLPGVRLVVGGHNASFVDVATLERYPWFDAVVRGEGEVTFAALVEAWAAGGDLATVAGVTWRGPEGTVANPDRALVAELDTLPLPDYALLPPLCAYRDACGLPRSIAILEVGRGCPHRCVYCSEAALWRHRSRTFSVDRLAGEMKALRDAHGAECFLLAYDQFTADRRFVEAFCRRLLDEGLQTTPWYCISRLDTVDAGLLALMRRAGCESMCYGIDSGSPRTLAFIRKRIDPAILRRRVHATTAQGLVPTLSFVIGFPEEGLEDIDATLELALQTAATGSVNPLVQLPTVLPGTELHARYAGRLRREVDTYFALGLEFAGGRRLEEDEATIAADPAIHSSFYNLPCPGLPLPRLDRLARGFPLLVQLYPRSFLLLGRALAASPTLLFEAFLAFVAGQAGGREAEPTPADCRRHFPPFARAELARVAPAAWPHLPEMIAYETCCLEVARFANNEIPGNIDLCNLAGWRPQRPRNVLTAAFRHDLPAIVADLRAGDIRPGYPEAPTWLVFRQQGTALTVDAVNEFGHDLLKLCGGGLSPAELAERLRPRYGGGMPAAAFDESCREALHRLAELELVAAAEAPDLREGR